MQKENAQIVKISKRGFTLLELLIVIGILAILATTVTIVLNPAELLRQARDSQRLSDLQSLNTAVNLYVSTYSTSTYFTGASTNATGTCSVASGLASTPFNGAGSCNFSASTVVDGTGWATVNLKLVPSGSPLSKLPLDPANGTTYYYAFKATSTPNAFWEIDGVLESDKYVNNQQLMVNDGGSSNSFYEIGSYPGLNL